MVSYGGGMRHGRSYASFADMGLTVPDAKITGHLSE
jgi:hypothetical protein